MAYTITEALQEIKTINKRIEVKRQSVTQYAVRNAMIKDPLEKDGGSTQYIARERQAISDLENRIVQIRTAIQRSNLSTIAAIQGRTRSVAEWLTWRREVSQGEKNFLNQIAAGIKQVRDKLQREGGRLIPAANEPQAATGEAVIHLDEQELNKQREDMEIILGELDGKLSLLNATTVIDA